LIALFIVVVFASTAYFFVRVNNQRNGRLQTALVEKQKQANADREYAKEMKKQKDIAAIKRGDMKMLTGYIEEIKDDEIMIDIDPLGKHENYKINVHEKTTYQILSNEIVYENNEFNENGDLVTENEITISKSDFSMLKKGKMIEIHFKKRVDVDVEKELVASRIVIFNF